MKKIILFTVCTIITLACAVFCYLYASASKQVDSGTVKLEKKFEDHYAEVLAVRFSPDGKFIASGSIDSTVIIRDRMTGKTVCILRQPEGVTALDFSPDGQYLVTASYDSEVRLWSVATGTLIRQFSGKKGTVWTVSFSPGSELIAAAGDDKTISVWNIRSGLLIHEMKGHSRNIWTVKFSPDGSMIASGSFDMEVKLWNTGDGSLIRTLTGHTEAVVDLAFSHDGKLLATTSDDKTIKLWNLINGSINKTFEVAEHIQAVAFSPDDKRLMTGGRDKIMIGELIQNFTGDSERWKGVSARLWDVETGEMLHTFSSHKNDVNDVAYSPDGRWIATASADRSVQLWRVMK